MALLEVTVPEGFDDAVLRAKEPTVVLFWASWCPFCLAFRPAFTERAARSDARFAIVSLDDYENPLWDTYRVEVVPTLAYFQDGELTARRDGVLMRGLAPADLTAFLDEVLRVAEAG